MEEKIRALVLQLGDIVRKQTKGNYPDVNEALRSLRDYVQETTAFTSGLEDRLNELDYMLATKSEKKKPFIDQIEKIRRALGMQRRATPKVTMSKEEKSRKPSSPAPSERTTPLPSKTKQMKTLSNPASRAPGGRVSHVQGQIIYVQPSSNESSPQTTFLQAERYELTQTDETTELSGTIQENEEQYQDEMADEVRFFMECLNGLKKVLSDDIKNPLEKIIPVAKGKMKKKVETEYRYIMDVAGDISRLKTENQYLKKTLDGLHKYIIDGDETALNELKTPKHMKDNQSIVEVEAKVKEVTQKFHETKTNAEHVTEESKCLFSTMECLISHVQGLSDGKTESDISSALIHSLDQIKSSVKKESPANQFLTQAKEIIGIQMEWKREAEYATHLIEELNERLVYDGKQDTQIGLKEPPVQMARASSKDGKKGHKKQNDEKPKSRHSEQLQSNYSRASNVLKMLIDLSASKQEMANKIKEYEQNYEKLKAEHQKLKTAYTTLEKRCNEDNALSEHAGALLTYENPSIADLSDPNRPTKLAERYLELYDCRWTDAFSNLSKKDPDISENNIIGYLYEILVNGYRFCEDVRRKQILALEDILFDPAGGTKTNQRRQEEMSQRFAKHLSDISNLSSNVTSENMAKAFVMEEKTKDKYRNMIKLCETYILECVRLCWLMLVHTPPLCLDVKTIHGQSFDKNCYKEYRKRGKEIAFVVWPALFLHENGPLLSKGVAQGQ